MSTDEERREIARALASLRRVVTVPCTVCGKPMTGMTHRKTCSDTCRVKLYRTRKKAKQQQETPSNENQQ